jgi:hypothetical protein
LLIWCFHNQAICITAFCWWRHCVLFVEPLQIQCTSIFITLQRRKRRTQSIN